jgi:hypothetical protein
MDKKLNKLKIMKLESCLVLLKQAYSNLNEVSVILSTQYKIDDDCKFLVDDFHLVYNLGVQSKVWEQEKAIKELIVKLNK